MTIIRQCFFFFLAIFVVNCSAMTINEYLLKQKNDMDREYAPLTTEMCRNEKKFEHLKSCILARDDEKRLDKISKHIFSEINEWEDFHRRRKESKQSGYYYVVSPSRYHGRYRIYRISNDEREEKDERDGRRKKRNIDPKKYIQKIFRNPCLTGQPMRTTIFFGIDAETNEVVELFQDPKNRLYQTFFTRKCSRRSAFGFHCVTQYVQFLSAVYDKKSYKVVTRPVKVPTNCAMSFQG